jgi:hypothetical protein
MSLEKILGDKASSIIPNDYSKFLVNRLRWLENFPSKHSSENNHRVAEVAAQLAVYSRLGLQSKRSRACEKELSKLIVRQFAGDGLNKEQSFGYHLFTLDLVATAKILVPGLWLSDDAVARLQKAHQTTLDIYAFCGFWPSANDSDEAQLLGCLETSNKPAFELFSAVFGGIEGAIDDSSVLHLNESGFLFAKDEQAGNSLVLMVDHGPLGLGPLFAHAHADLQAIWLWSNREPILVEAGTYTYHASEEFRRRLQGSISHNSVSVNTKSIAEPAGPFLWEKSHLPDKAKLNFYNKQEKLFIEMSCHLPLKHLKMGPATWHRDLEFGGGLLSVSDWLVSSSDHTLGSQFIFGEALATEFEDERMVNLIDGDLVLEITTNGRFERIIDFPISPRYSHLSQGKKLAISANNEQNRLITSTIRVRRKAWK